MIIGRVFIFFLKILLGTKTIWTIVNIAKLWKVNEKKQDKRSTQHKLTSILDKNNIHNFQHQNLLNFLGLRRKESIQRLNFSRQRRCDKVYFRVRTFFRLQINHCKLTRRTHKFKWLFYWENPVLNDKLGY